MRYPQASIPETEKSDLIKPGLRLPADLYEELKQVAKAEDRTVRSLVTFALRTFVASRKSRKRS